ncbi:MAG: ComGF family competence protein [Lysinibacillus sp.]|nr:ComGF family competence protein [Lysinibacillus sp.]
MYQRRKLSNKGFTLIEALFQLIVYSLFAQLVILFILFIRQENNSILTNELVQWETFLRDLQQFLIQVDEIEVDKQSIVIKYSTSTEIKINKSSDVIWFQMDNKGYIPLLIGVRYAHFSAVNDYLTIEVEFINGIVKERTLFVQYDK